MTVSTVYERLKAFQIKLPDVQPPVVDGYVSAFVPFVSCVEIEMVVETFGSERVCKV